MEKAVRKPTTFRIDPDIKGGLEKLGKILGQPLNKLANEALGEYVARRTRDVENDLQATLDDLRAYRKSDPDFERAIDAFVEAEATGAGDPVDGRAEEQSGPVETTIRELLSE
ncbi:MAG: hypothetical protein ACTSV1_08610 [Alphaproteobacteria bacterium]